MSGKLFIKTSLIGLEWTHPDIRPNYVCYRKLFISSFSEFPNVNVLYHAHVYI